MATALPAIDQRATKETKKAVGIEGDFATKQVSDHIAKAQIPYTHAYQFHGYDPSKDPLLIRKKPILRPLVDFKGMEFHRHWPLEYLSQRLQKEREKELSHFRRLFQLRVTNPYTAVRELDFYKFDLEKQKQARKSHNPDAPKQLHLASESNPGPHHSHYVPPELKGGSHILQQKLRTRYQKYRHLVHPPQHTFPHCNYSIALCPTCSQNGAHDSTSSNTEDVFTRLATRQKCKHVEEEIESATPPRQSAHNHPPPPQTYFAQLAQPKPRPPPEPAQARPLHRCAPPSKERLEKLSKPRVVYPVYEYPDSGILKEMPKWRPMTHNLVMSTTQKDRLNQISLPRNWQEIQEMRAMYAEEQPVPSGVSANEDINELNRVKTEADPNHHSGLTENISRINASDEKSAIEDAIEDDHSLQEQELANKAVVEASISLPEEEMAPPVSGFQAIAVSSSETYEDSSLQVETTEQAMIEAKAMSPQAQSLSNIADKITQSLHSLRNSIRRASTVKNSRVNLVASSKTASNVDILTDVSKPVSEAESALVDSDKLKTKGDEVSVHTANNNAAGDEVMFGVLKAEETATGAEILENATDISPLVPEVSRTENQDSSDVKAVEVESLDEAASKAQDIETTAEEMYTTEPSENRVAETKIEAETLEDTEKDAPVNIEAVKNVDETLNSDAPIVETLEEEVSLITADGLASRTEAKSETAKDRDEDVMEPSHPEASQGGPSGDADEGFGQVEAGAGPTVDPVEFEPPAEQAPIEPSEAVTEETLHPEIPKLPEKIVTESEQVKANI
ncbi:hypothetical protein BC830DRAFT_1233230 [Chytriomyces sp. MP71]|nr:hypothetical protein BC830DRAFT_1233230 [Chytriomyces sp. MP71]